MLKVGQRPGVPFHVDLTPAELEVNRTNKRWEDHVLPRREEAGGRSSPSSKPTWTFDPQRIARAPRTWLWDPVAELVDVEDAERLASQTIPRLPRWL